MTETQRTTELCVLGSEAEAMAMAMELRENGIVPVVLRAASVGFPGIVDRSRWGTLRVDDGDVERAREILEAWYARDDDDVDEDELERQALEASPRSEEERHHEVASIAPPYRGAGRPTRGEVTSAPARPVPVSALVAGASIALNVGLGVWILADREEPSLGGVTTAQDEDGRPLGEWHWEAGHDHPSRGVSFDVRGARTFEYVDRDMDGREERFSFYDRDGRIIDRSFDADEDGWHERTERYDRSERVAAEGHDEDGDGRLDTFRVHATEDRESLLLRDDDADGFFETLVCDGEERAIRCP